MKSALRNAYRDPVVPKSRYAEEQEKALEARHGQTQTLQAQGQDERLREKAYERKEAQRRLERRRSLTDKPLPKDPDLIGAAVKATIPRAHPVHLDLRFQSPREKPPTPREVRAHQHSRMPSEKAHPPPIDPKQTLQRNESKRLRAPTAPQNTDTVGFDHRSATGGHGHNYNDPTFRAAHGNSRTNGDQYSAMAPPSHPNESARHSRNLSDKVPRAAQRGGLMSNGSTDSAYASGSDQHADKRWTHGSAATPTRLGLFPSGPGTPMHASRSNSISLRSPGYTTSSGRGPPNDSERPKSSSFSIRNVFSKKSKDGPALVREVFS